jgi:hypothetical protein
LSTGNAEASQAKRRQYDATNANWMRVRVAGLGHAVRIDFEDVLVRADEAYHMTQRVCRR